MSALAVGRLNYFDYRQANISPCRESKQLNFGKKDCDLAQLTLAVQSKSFA